MKKSERKSPNKSGIDRRTFVKLLPAAGAAGLAVSGLPLKAAAQTPTPSPLPTPRPSPTPAPRITQEMMHNAEKLIGIELTDKQEGMALPGVNRALDSYEAVRKIDVPLDTEPAIAFHPALP
ncbi:MAG TPA: twin-arginine translocation signal domain-containing protein, partial [Pyrinomonadaceae bacterium]|nr:twin-arginine translocation signal domain-containing protein [Pyrinomonadaceae bacterium]